MLPCISFQCKKEILDTNEGYILNKLLTTLELLTITGA